MDFGLLPPEVNSGRMYTGPGPGPLLAAAAAWDGLAVELHNMAATYESAVTELGSGWQGPSATMMAAAAAPYTAWLHSTAAQAEQAATQSRTAAAAYESAFAATVPPPVVTANRSLLMTLVATNFLGQNTPAIAATESHYAQMWAQDAVAMYGYAASATAATRLLPFAQPPQTANPAGVAGQSRAVGQAVGTATGANAQSQLSRLTTLVPNVLRNLATGAAAPAADAAPVSPVQSLLNNISGVILAATGPYSPLGPLGVAGGWWLAFGQILGLSQNPPGVAALLSGPKPITGALAPLAGHLAAAGGQPAAGGAVSGALSRAGLVGGLSVPPSWAASAPAIKAVAAAMPAAGAPGVPMAAAETPAGLFGGTAALSSLAGRAMDASAARSMAGAAPRTIGATANCLGVATEELDNSVTILVIPPPDQ